MNKTDEVNLGRRRPGPIAAEGTTRANIVIDLDLLEWGKRQPGGLSALVRKLLREEMERQEGRQR